jgi:hypothetical protein
MRTLNRRKPYCEVFGLPGARYEQDGVLFKANEEALFADDSEDITRQAVIFEDKIASDTQNPVEHVAQIERVKRKRRTKKEMALDGMED